jgi:fatty acid desaturase
MLEESPLGIPGRLNIGLALVAMAAACALLWVVAHAESLALRLLGAVAFSYVGNTLFSLLHEAVHGVFHADARFNAGFGRWLAAFFPTSFTLQRFFHLGHHRRNRSAAERFDYIAPGENVLLKNVQWYGILTGLYWLLPPLSALAYLVAPSAFASRWIRGEEAGWERQSGWSRQSGADAMVEGLERLPALVVRAEVLFAIAWQVGVFVLLDLNWQAWALCHGAFAVNWSSLQYADHAWSPLDRTEGAWNLRVNGVVRWLFLNYHHHRVHHENPKVPWIHLPRFVDAAEPRPSFLRIYLSMWRGPRPLPDVSR